MHFSDLSAHLEIIEGSVSKQSLSNHLLHTAQRAEELGTPLKLGNMCTLIGLLHDFGKASPDFQEYLLGQTQSGGDHSSMGGYCVNKIKEEWKTSPQYTNDDKNLNGYCEMLTYPILAHHGIYDVLSADYELRTKIRLDLAENRMITKNESVNFLPYLNELDQFSYWKFHKNLLTLFDLGFHEYLDWNKKIQTVSAEVSPKHKRQTAAFFQGATVRLLLSILKEADIYDSSNWNREDKDKVLTASEMKAIWNDMENKIEGLYQSFAKNKGKSIINDVRSELADETFSAANNTADGCFTLDMPVGSGKTLAGMRYAIRHALLHDDHRIFYVTAYLSVLEQNAKDIKNIIGQDYVLEHHSNVIEEENGDDNEEEYSLRSYLKDSWESPVVLTTMVQLTNTLFKGKSSNIRRFCKLAHSVIIMDEVQSLPLKTVYLMNLMTDFLTHFMGTVVIHCTATLPALDKRDVLTYPCLYGTAQQPPSLVTSKWSHHSVFSRVRFYSLLGSHFSDQMETADVLAQIRENLKDSKSILLILNTKSAVNTMCQAAKEEFGDSVDVVYLTTNLCAAHRLERIAGLKEQLRAIREGKRKKPLLCVSTNLISAGVNVDFDVVLDSMTSIDGVLQASGRCNREGKLAEKGKVYLLAYRQESFSHLPEMRKAREAAAKTLRKIFPDGLEKNRELDLSGNLEAYYKNLYRDDVVQSTLSYPVKNGNETILSYLGRNNTVVEGYNEVHHPEKIFLKRPFSTSFMLRQSFKTAADQFELIDEGGITAIVHYKNEDLLNDLYEAIDSEDYGKLKGLLKKLQRYTVTIRNPEKYADYLEAEDMLKKYGIYILNESCYDADVGLNKSQMQDEIF
ncbi:MAG: CRISPR-associated endonuclease Cas3'' [Acidaminococcus sp.]|nr:CRISPR-associated endonuclease Cas3'' [Acidaminococcus sp.]MCI2100913.1 CRISPR-associated endonuclease Cas3'' [Acidaminococcus sp.]